MPRPRAALASATLVLLIGSASATVAVAQAPPDSARPAPYSQLRFRLSGARIVNREPIGDFWRSNTGGSLGIAAPFYVGSIGVSGTVIPFRTRDGTQRPNFRALLLGVDWGGTLPLPGPLRLQATARVGDFVMLIENPDVWLDSESELFVGGELSAALPLRGPLALTAAGSYAHVRTRPTLDVALLAVGLELSTRTPGWLRAILE